jgi:iron complex transport system substrate-binding protein
LLDSAETLEEYPHTQQTRGTRHPPPKEILMRPALLFFLFVIALPALAEPIEISHRFGTTRIDVPPQRIVSVGYHEQDFLYALGLAPVGVHEWFGARPYATWIWAETARKAAGAKPQVQRGFEIDLEWVWQLQPDLIVASFAPMDAATYAQLSRIAPVVGPPACYPDWGAPWQEELRLIGRATGRLDQAESVIIDVATVLADTRTRYPSFEGSSAAVAHIAGTKLIGYGYADGPNRFMVVLGFHIPEEFEALANTAGNFSVSLERIDLFERDLALWLSDAAGQELIEALPGYQASTLAQSHRSVWADEQETGAMSFQTPLSIPWAAQRLAPKLQQALRGGEEAKPD